MARKTLLLLALILAILLGLARVARADEDAIPEDVDGGVDDSEIDAEIESAEEASAEPLGEGQQEMTPEQMEQQKQIQRLYLQFLMKGTSETCREQLSAAIAKKTPEEDPFTPECQTELSQLQESFRARLAEAQETGVNPFEDLMAGGAAGGAAGAPGAEDEGEPEPIAWGVVGKVLLLTALLLGAPIAWSVRKYKAGQAYLEANPEVRRKLEEKRARDERKAAKQRAKQGAANQGMQLPIPE